MPPFTFGYAECINRRAQNVERLTRQRRWLALGSAVVGFVLVMGMLL